MSSAPSRGAAEAGSFIQSALTSSGILDAESSSAYGSLFSRFMSHQRKANLDWGQLTPPFRDMLVDYTALEPCPEHEPLHHVRAEGRGMLGATVVRCGVGCRFGNC